VVYARAPERELRVCDLIEAGMKVMGGTLPPRAFGPIDMSQDAPRPSTNTQ
jgi:hypothetical protein